jgi:hypothetical protein
VKASTSGVARNDELVTRTQAWSGRATMSSYVDVANSPKTWLLNRTTDLVGPQWPAVRNPVVPEVSPMGRTRNPTVQSSIRPVL